MDPSVRPSVMVHVWLTGYGDLQREAHDDDHDDLRGVGE